MEDGGAGGSGGIANTPPTFAGITSVSPANESVLLVTWAPASDDSTASEAILYHVYVADSAGGQSFDTPTLTTAPGASSVQLTGLDSATTYFIVVRAEDGDALEDGNSTELSAQPQLDTEPPTFAGITGGMRLSAQEVRIEWSPATDNLTAAQGMVYAVFWSESADGPDFDSPSFATQPGASEAVVSVPQPDTTYYFGVRAIDAAGNSDKNSTFIPANSSPDTTPPTFGGCSSAVVTGASTVLVSWLPATDDVTPSAFMNYHVYAATEPGGHNFATAPQTSFFGPAPSGEVTGLSANTTYYFVCRAADSSNNSDDNLVQVASTTLADSSPPTFVGIESVGNPGSDSLDVSWEAASDNATPPQEILYNIYAATTVGAQDFSTPTATSAPGALTHTVTGLDGGTQYFFVVRAVDLADNEDTNSVQLSGLTLIPLDMVQAVFTMHCGISGCHQGATAANEMRLDDSFFTYEDLCGSGAATTCTPVPSQNHASMNRIQPNNTSTSWLYLKLTNAHVLAGGCDSFCGESMPPPSCPTCSVPTADQIQLVADWINQGAQNP